MVSFTGTTVTVAAPAGHLVQFLSGCTGPTANPSGCAASAHLTIDCIRLMTPCQAVTYTTVPAGGDGGRTELVPLAAACNNVTLTWPNGTPASEVTAAVAPPDVLDAIWRYDVAARTFRAYSPRSSAVSDLATVDRLDAVFICMRTPGSLSRPAL